MRFLWILIALAVSVVAQPDDWVEEEELEEPYNEENHEHYGSDASQRTRRDLRDEEYYRYDENLEHHRSRRDVHDEGPYEEHVRVKRCTYEDVPISRVRRSADYVRVPRQVHQYEVHEATDDSYPSSPPYEEMLAASAEHYHKVYAAPGAPSSARYLSPDVSAPIVYRPVSSVSSNLHAQATNQNAFIPSNFNVLSQQSPTQYHQAQYALPPKPIQYVEQTQFVPVKASIKVADVPSSVKNPIGIIQAPGLGPVPEPSAPVHVASGPVASIEAVPLDGEGDQLEAAAVVKHHKHATGHRQGGGHSKHGQFDAHRGGKVCSMFFVLT